MVSKQNSIVYATDSRGKDFGKALKNSDLLPPKTRVVGESKGGAKLEELFKLIRIETGKEAYLFPQNQITVLISGGICDITVKSKGQVNFEEDCNKLQRITQTLDNIWNYCQERNYTLILTTILPVSLVDNTRYQIQKGYLRGSRYTEEELKEQQSKANILVCKINQYIKDKSIDCSTIYVDIYRNIENRVLKINKTTGSRTRKSVTIFGRLADGVHPNPKLQNTITNKIINACKVASIPAPKEKTIKRPITETSEESQSESDIEGWQLKRIKNQ